MMSTPSRSETLAGDLTLATLGEMSAASLFLEHPLRRRARPGEFPESPLRAVGTPRARRGRQRLLVHGGGQKAAAAPLQAAQAQAGHRVEVRRAHGVGVLRLRRRRGAQPRLDDRPGGVISSCRPSGRTAARRGRRPAHQRLPRSAADRREGQAVLVAARRRSRSAVADAVLGAPEVALEELRWALDARHARRAGLGLRGRGPGGGPATRRLAGMRDADLAKEVGVPPWKLRTIRDQSRGWSDAGISRVIRAIAQADADIKGAASDASYTGGWCSPSPACATSAERAPRAGARAGAPPWGRRLEQEAPERGGGLRDGRLAVGGLVLVDDAPSRQPCSACATRRGQPSLPRPCRRPQPVRGTCARRT